MVLQVHDELIFEVKDGNEELLKEFQSEIKYQMVKAVRLNVPVIVDSKKGKSWADLV
jgi:DNA polymerase I-like protein with 3'-5' exonuclease and polymerase domains